MNIIKYPENECPECNSKSEFFIIDYERGEEVYCSSCGCVLIDNSFLSISQLEYLLNKEYEEKLAEMESK